MNRILLLSLLSISCLLALESVKAEKANTSVQKSIINESDWQDTQGKPILAHDGHITRVKDTFYWYGSSYAGNPEGRYGTAAGYAVWNGIQVYSSKNLVDWTYQGVALPRPKKGWGAVGSAMWGSYFTQSELNPIWFRV